MRINRQSHIPRITEIVPEYTNADTWTAYEAFNDNLLDPDKNIYKTSTAYTAATDRNNGAAAIWCQPIYWDMAMNAYKRAKAEGDTERETNTSSCVMICLPEIKHIM